MMADDDRMQDLDGADDAAALDQLAYLMGARDLGPTDRLVLRFPKASAKRAEAVLRAGARALRAARQSSNQGAGNQEEKAS